MLQATYSRHRLKFKFVAGTSRGTMTERDTWFIRVWDSGTGHTGVGEVSPLLGLSIDDVPDFEVHLSRRLEILEGFCLPKDEEGCFDLAMKVTTPAFPSICFALETALLDLLNGGKGIIFKNRFADCEQALAINGLVWMGDGQFMKTQVEEKLRQGFTCIKMKIGAIDLEREMEILRGIRERYSASQVSLRVDANGAFSPMAASKVMHRLADLDVHSIEQPIRQGQWDEMAQLCREGAIPIALDEELIGISKLDQRIELLDRVRPQFLILKPTLLGGFRSCAEWIRLAEEREIGWWVTSALESNIGLDAIAQFTAEYQNSLPQGLGTGQLYSNNVDSPLVIVQGTLVRKMND